MNILCFGDSNTFGYNPTNGLRYDKNTRWTGVLQNLLGDNFNVIEEGLNGRTTIFDEPYFPGRCGIDDIVPCLDLHKPIDLLIVMLGTNYTKEIFHANSDDITKGLEILVRKAMSASYDFRDSKPNVLIVAPVPIKYEVIYTPWASDMGLDCVRKSLELGDKYEKLADDLGCHFFDAAACGFACKLDSIHLDEDTHSTFAYKLYKVIFKIFSNKYFSL